MYIKTKKFILLLKMRSPAPVRLIAFIPLDSYFWTKNVTLCCVEGWVSKFMAYRALLFRLSTYANSHLWRKERKRSINILPILIHFFRRSLTQKLKIIFTQTIKPLPDWITFINTPCKKSSHILFAKEINKYGRFIFANKTYVQ